MPRPIAIAALLICAASGCSSLPAPAAASHPPAADLTCPAEPAALSDAQLLDETATPDGRPQWQVNLDAWNDQVLLAGRGCRDALARVCRWHVERGLQLPAGIRCG